MSFEAAGQIDGAKLRGFVTRIQTFDRHIEALQAEQIHALKEIERLRWPDSWRGKDGRRIPSRLQRFLPNVVQDVDTGCWKWVGRHLPKGYGLFNHTQVNGLAHRFICEFVYGPIPKGLHVDHLCSNPPCVNPAHLEPVTPAENFRRGRSRQVQAALKGSKTHCPHGHAYTTENTYVFGNGWRTCRVCARRRRAEYAAKKGKAHG